MVRSGHSYLPTLLLSLCAQKKVTKEKAPQRNSPFGVRCGARKNPEAGKLASLKQCLLLNGFSLRSSPVSKGVKTPEE
jgi:hypothetical protein